MKTSFYIVLFVAFIDHMGVGLVYPMFSSMLFDVNLPLLPVETCHETRGLLLGVLLSIMPLAQFFSSPVWGALSDSKGRKKPMQLSLLIALAGYLIALAAVAMQSLALLIASRVVIGSAAGNMSIVQAAIADLSMPEEKAKNYGLYGMALGTGFTIGPLLGGVLSSFGYAIPFLFAAAIIALNIAFTIYYFKETLHTPVLKRVNIWAGLSQLRKAFQMTGIKSILLASFLHCFAWSYFFEFSPVYLITRFQFTPADLGLYYGVAGGIYALSTGLLIRPLVSRLTSETLFAGGMFFTALTIFLFAFLPSSLWVWIVLVPMCYFVAFIWPTGTTIVSNSASKEIQGEALGVLSSLNAAAFVLSPLCSGSVVGAHPTLPMWVGGSVMMIAALLIAAVFRRRLFSLESI